MSNPESNTPAILSLKSDDDALVIDWGDGQSQRLLWKTLRDSCPCATCRTKRDEPAQLLPVISVEEAQPIRPTAMTPMGNYAYNISFSDGHNTGIYSLEFLRSLS